jgi:glycine cleavage system H protein
MADFKTPDDLKYTESDEWVRIDGDTATIGITDYAQDALNDLVFVDFLGEEGDDKEAGDSFAEVESVKAASEVYMPIGGEILEYNENLEDEPELINDDPYGDGWIVKVTVTDDSTLSELMDAAAYQEYCENR